MFRTYCGPTVQKVHPTQVWGLPAIANHMPLDEGEYLTFDLCSIDHSHSQAFVVGHKLTAAGSSDLWLQLIDTDLQAGRGSDVKEQPAGGSSDSSQTHISICH